jgi:hypothetical protein
LSILVAIDSHEASLRRYECSDTRAKLTHEFVMPGPVIFPMAVVQEMRSNPPDHLSVTPPPRPTNSPAGAGTATIQRAA